MTLTMNQGLDIQGLMLRLKNEKIPLKTAYKFNKLLNVLEKELSFYQEKINEIISEYSQKDEDGNPILSEDKTSVQIIKDKIEECQKKMEELSNIEFEINDISFALDELENIDLTVLEVRSLMPLIKE